VTAGDGKLALTKELERLQIAISNHIKVSRETGFKLKFADFDASLNLAAGAMATAAAFAAGLPILEALIPGAAATMAVKIGPSLKKHQTTPTPFKYVSSYHDELF
jgi:hypothetical protein